MNTELTVIHIMTHPPAYDEYGGQPRPKINWDTPNGSWVGIWGYDWADLLAIECRKLDPSIDHEIWQPDLRADKVYSHELFPGVTHRLFPAFIHKQWIGLKKHKLVDSPGMIYFSELFGKETTEFHISRNITHPINRLLIRKNPEAVFIASFHGEIQMPRSHLYKFQKNISAKLYYLKEHFRQKKMFQKISWVTYQSRKNLDDLRRYYNGPISQLTMGIYFNDYRNGNRELSRRKLGVSSGKKVLITITSMRKGKQLDKLIEVLSDIKQEFLFIVIGHGKREYEDYIKKKAQKLIQNNKILFSGYRSGQEKIELLAAADLFIHMSRSEAGPVVNMEAMAAGLPIMTTDTGHTAEFLREQRAGCILGTSDYPSWRLELERFLSGKEIIKADPESARKQYDWTNVAKKCREVYINVSVHPE